MEGVTVEDDWRTIQFFLGPEGVSEVEVNTSQKSYMRCKCKLFATKSKCPHIVFMKNRLVEQNGALIVTLPPNVPTEEILRVQEDAQAFRELIIKYGTIEVIE